MPATYSMEGKLETGLREIQCSARNFIKIAKGSGIAISDGKFSEALSDKGRLDTVVGEKLLVLLEEMAELKRTLVAPDWADAANICEQLALLRAWKQAVEYDEDRIRQLLLEQDSGAH